MRRILFLLASLVCLTIFGQGLPARIMADLRRAISTGYVYPNVTTGLKYWWALDNGTVTGSNIVDSVSGRNMLIYQGAHAWTNGMCAGALYFSNTWVTTPDPTFANDPGDITISAWTKYDTMPTTKPVIFTFSCNGWDKTLHSDSGKPAFMVYNGATRTVTSPSTLSTGVWHHVCVTVSSTAGCILYADAVPVQTNALMTGSFSGTGCYVIGHAVSGYNDWLGYIDDVRLYTNALTPDDISVIYQWRPTTP